MTPWIDIHAHFTPPEPSQPTWSPDYTIACMDRAGISLQMLSNIPTSSLSALQSSNSYCARLVAQYPTRFGFLAALPTDNPEACLTEISRCLDGKGVNGDGIKADGFAVTANYKGTALFSSPELDEVWAELDRRKASVFCHPNTFSVDPHLYFEVAFETTRVAIDLLYSAHFRRYPNVKLCLAQCGGALPALSGRLLALGTDAWVPNPNALTKKEMEEQLHSLYLETAGNASSKTNFQPGLGLVGHKHIVYGSDWVPGTTEAMAEANHYTLSCFEGLTKKEMEEIGQNALQLFPQVKKRLGL
ncbi:hypothetical protein BT96DRAFT_995943 [Gymnopus androsaceus JB14]|uniref:6-methylsalicylate decarboxylase n=1 Tax=Gymnopus androsaceus JB14 TaxID=1447944 RepID=A0A6A4HFJ0_9AGAR|nr:hypothetical protein BT96DRAFT_995943 [Gymnopus androsaceus JB14]